jgi:hypothetical protein
VGNNRRFSDGESFAVELVIAREGRAMGRLPGGELYYVALGEMRHEHGRVQRHLCRRWFKMVAGNRLLAAHGWTPLKSATLFF